MSNGGSLRISTASKAVSGSTVSSPSRYQSSWVPVVSSSSSPRIARNRRAALEREFALLAHEQPMPARRHLDHHRIARILVRLQFGQRVEDDGDAHGRAPVGSVVKGSGQP
jgi:hypothetical protein